MDFSDLISKAKSVRSKYAVLEMKKYEREWTGEEIAQGFVGDVGDLMKLVMAKNGIRDIEDVDAKLAHELSDCLWSIMLIADKYQVDLEKSFLRAMDELEKRIDSEK